VAQQDRRSAILVTCLASFLLPFMGGASNVAVRAIGDEFHADAASLSWFVTSFFVVSAMFLLPLGRLGDLWGRKRTFLAGGAVFCVGSALCVVAPSLGLLIAARAVQGAGGAMLAATSPAILISVFPPQERRRPWPRCARSG
jgi:MFS family permease